MDTKLLEYLKDDVIRNAYVIKALETNIRDFECVTADAPEMSYIALWHEDQIATLRGQAKWCQPYFDKYYGRYDFYDMDAHLLTNLLSNSVDAFEEDYSLESHYLMQLGVKGDDLLPKAKSLKNNYKIRKLKTVKKSTRYQYIQENGKKVGSVLIEEVSGEIYILSEMIIEKPFRQQGLAYSFVSSLVKQVKSNQPKADECLIVLYVDQENEPALKLYKKLGFEVVDVFKNLVINE